MEWRVEDLKWISGGGGGNRHPRATPGGTSVSLLSAGGGVCREGGREVLINETAEKETVPNRANAMTHLLAE